LTLHLKVCAYVHCQKPFETKDKNQLCCSRPCALRHKQPHTPEGIKMYLLKHVDIPENPDACWLWKGPIQKKSGYGLACFMHIHPLAHRTSYEIFVAPIPESLHVLHVRHCPHRRCINPRHLYAGTNAQNIADKVALGRTPHGSSHCHARLTESDVLQILDLYHATGSKHTRETLGKLFGVSGGTIRPILQRKTWKHVAPGQYPYDPQRGKHLTANNVRTLRRLHEDGWSLKALAETYHITSTQVQNIIRRVSWPNIT
jgi:hypothetical protein